MLLFLTASALPPTAIAATSPGEQALPTTARFAASIAQAEQHGCVRGYRTIHAVRSEGRTGAGVLLRCRS